MHLFFLFFSFNQYIEIGLIFPSGFQKFVKINFGN